VSLDDFARDSLDALHKAGTYRRLRSVRGEAGPHLRVDGRPVRMFAGSNYLDLAHHPEVVEAAARAAQTWGVAAGGSRLINGNLAAHEALEEELAAFFGTQSALTFGTGYMANVGLLPALVGQEDAIFSDALCHASIIDGARLAQARVHVFPHGDAAELERLLRAHRTEARRALVLVDGLYSMDGDTAPLGELVPIAQRWDAWLLVDDTHGTGTIGPEGRGTAALHGIAPEQIDLLVGSLAKALGSYGAFVAGSSRLRDLLINTCRSFIFSCALPPPQVEAARAALRVMQREPWRRERLAHNADRLRQALATRGLSTAPSTTHILPLVIGENRRTMDVCEQLLERGFFAHGIRFPSVPKGSERLRITVMATHTDEDIDGLAEAIGELLAPHRDQGALA